MNRTVFPCSIKYSAGLNRWGSAKRLFGTNQLPLLHIVRNGARHRATAGKDARVKVKRQHAPLNVRVTSAWSGEAKSPQAVWKVRRAKLRCARNAPRQKLRVKELLQKSIPGPSGKKNHGHYHLSSLPLPKMSYSRVRKVAAAGGVEA